MKLHNVPQGKIWTQYRLRGKALWRCVRNFAFSIYMNVVTILYLLSNIKTVEVKTSHNTLFHIVTYISGYFITIIQQ
jgi:hypothetical protein